jgi:hypothetical protein
LDLQADGNNGEAERHGERAKLDQDLFPLNAAGAAWVNGAASIPLGGVAH